MGELGVGGQVGDGADREGGAGGGGNGHYLVPTVKLWFSIGYL